MQPSGDSFDFFLKSKKKHINIKKYPENLPVRIPPLKFFMWGFFSWKIKEKRPPHIKNWGSQIFMLGTP